MGVACAPPALSDLQSVATGFSGRASALLADAYETPLSPTVELAAYRRELAGRGPAHKGTKKCLKDCLVAESLLEFADATPLTARGPLVFLTYNHKDFTSGGTKPHVDLAADFLRLGIQLVTSWGWAVHSLGI